MTTAVPPKVSISHLNPNITQAIIPVPWTTACRDGGDLCVPPPQEPVLRRPEGVLHAPSPEYQRQNEYDQEYEEQNLRYVRCGSRDAAKSKDRGDNRDDETEHG